MNASYRKARKGEITCEECRYSGVRAESGRLDCRGFERSYVAGRKHTCDKAELRGAQ
jgi:hypothetical protein